MRVSINKKLLGTFVAGTLFAMTLLVWSLFTVEGLISTLQEIGDLTRLVDRSADLNLRIQRLIKAMGDYLLAGDTAKREEVEVLLSGISETARLSEGGVDGEVEAFGRSVADGVRRLEAAASALLAADEPAGSREAARLASEAAALGEELMAEVEEFNLSVSAQRKRLMDEASASAGGTRIILYAFPPVGVFLLFMVFLYLRYYVSRPLTELYKGAERISNGDFSYRVFIRTGDELQDLAGAFNRMAAALREREAKLVSMLKVVDKMNQELIATSRYKADFLANISHELKTPLTHILGFSDLLMLKAGSEFSEDNRRYVDNIHRSGETLLRLIDDMLRVSRVATGGIVVDLKELDVRDAVNSVARAVRAEAEEKRLSFIFEVDEGVGTVRADREMFRQMLVNLLDNAVKYTPEGGSVELRVWQEKADRGEELRVRVRDTGVGIRPELRGSVFELFEQGDKGTTRRFGGMGMGLALVKRFVEFHGGRIWFDSEEGKGSVFEFSIPVNMQAACSGV